MEQNACWRGAARMRKTARLRPFDVVVLLAAIANVLVADAAAVRAQTASVSAWEAADFRAWSFIPYWISNSQIVSFGSDRVYDHLSDVIYHAGAQPRADATLATTATINTHLATLKAQQARSEEHTSEL